LGVGRFFVSTFVCFRFSLPVMSSPVKVIVGLGNPGARYEKTRHNVGFRILDLIAERERLKWKSEGKWESEVAKYGEVLLVKPQTFMNESGRAVGALTRFYRWKPEEVLVVYDDIALPLGNLRFRMSGGHGGHNGIRSMLAHLREEGFPRLKMGIGGGSGEELVGHVLGVFSKDERELLENTLARAADAVQLAASSGPEKAANEFNTRTQKQSKPQPEKQQEDESQIRRPDRPEHSGD